MLGELIGVLMKSKPETGHTSAIYSQFIAYKPSALVFFPHSSLYLIPLAYFLHQMRVSIQDTLAPFEDGPHSSLTSAIHSPWNKVCALLPNLLQHFSATSH